MLEREDFRSYKVDAGEIGAGHTVEGPRPPSRRTACPSVWRAANGTRQLSILRNGDEAPCKGRDLQTVIARR